MISNKNKRSSIFKFTITSVIAICFAFLTQCNLGLNSGIDYNTDIKPLINKNCISCHGGVKQNAGFSLLSSHTAFLPTESGHPAIIKGSSDSSEFIKRLKIDDPDERMPFDAHPLSEKEIKVFQKWIDQGANWGLHWSYLPLENKKIYENETHSSKQAFASDFIDKEIEHGLKDHNLKMNPPASKPELIRRVALDITGLPASKEILDAYLKENISYEELVDSLLSLSSFGEKWASMWLDIARYADSKGFEKDPSRSIWKYRDYVIQSLNKDKPYNDFIIEQLAGDLMDDPTDEQLIATGFHRNTPTNDEGGTNNEEFRVKAVLDRVNTTWEGIMGTTMACVQCHSHPYDPITHKEYYQSYAFFNNTRDADTHLDYPRLSFLDSLDENRLLQLKDWVSTIHSKEKANEIEKFVRTTQPIIYTIETDDLINAAFYDTKYLGLRQNGQARLKNVDLTDKKEIIVKVNIFHKNGLLKIRIDSPDGPILSAIKLNQKTKGYEIQTFDLNSLQGIHDLYFQYTNPSLNNPNQQGVQIDWLHFSSGFPGKKEKEYEKQKLNFYHLIKKSYPTTLIMIENQGDRIRESNMFDRGNWQMLGEKVNPDVPSVFPSLDSNRKDRLSFANWVVDKNNPLTSRTIVNKIWGQLFIQGIVKTVEDMGSQGSVPTHQELLDFLAYDFMHHQNWSLKQLIKTIVLSDTYKQSSFISDEKINKDPDNKWLSRAPRKRASSEQVRDQAVFLSGKLSKKMYGPPVMPFQPEGVWQSPYSGEKWKLSNDEDQYRRAIYTMIKRTALYPSMETFDMAQRQVCVSRRINTNSPLQALVTLNDPVFVEAANNLALRMKNEGGESVSEKINYAYNLVLYKDMEAEKLRILVELHQQTIKELKEQDESESIDFEQKGLEEVATAILNLDEVLNY